MLHPDEGRALGAVHQRLLARFPDVAPEIVEAALRVEYAALTGPIRDYVPLLAYKAAHQRLLTLADGEIPDPPSSTARPAVRRVA